MPSFSELLFLTEQFFTETSTSSSNLAEDLIQLSRAVYNYNNAQRAQKIFQSLKRIQRINLAAKFQHASKETDRLLLETRHYAIKDNDQPEFYKALKSVIKPVLMDLVSVCRACETAFRLSKLKISVHREWEVTQYVGEREIRVFWEVFGENKL